MLEVDSDFLNFECKLFDESTTEKVLWKHVLLRALKDLHYYELHENAYRFFNRKRFFVGSFPWICQAIAKDPKHAYDTILKYVNENKELFKHGQKPNEYLFKS